MKKSSKTILALLLSVLMLLGAMPLAGVFAAYSEGSDGPADYSAYLNTDSIRTATPDQIATMTFDYLDELLGRYGAYLMEEAKEDIPNFPFDMTSIDNLVASAVSLLKAGTLGGDFARLNVSAIDGKSRADGDLKLAYAALQFVADNAQTASKLLTGNFEFGTFFSFFGADEETEQEILDMFRNFSVYGLVKEAIGLEDDDTLDNWINTKLNELLAQISIGGGYQYDEETGEEIDVPGTALDVQIDISGQTLYEIIDAVLEGLVKMVTVSLTGQSFGPDSTFGDYLAGLADHYIGVGLEALGVAADSPIAIQQDSLYDALKKFVDALITGYEEDINKYLGVVNDFAKLMATPGAFMAVALDDELLAPYLIDPDSDFYQTIFALGQDGLDNLFETSIVSYEGKNYVITTTSYGGIYDEATQTYIETKTNDIYCATDLYAGVTAAMENPEVSGETEEDLAALYALTKLGAIFNPDSNLTVDDFDLVGNHDTYFGFIGEINHILAVAIDEVLSADTAAAIDWTDGSNEYFSANIWKLIKYAATSEDTVGLIEMLKALFSEDEVSPYIAAVNASDSLSAFVPRFCNVLFPMIEVEDAATFAQKIGYVNADSIEEVIAFFLNLLGKAVSEGSIDFTDAIISNGAYVAADAVDYWKNTSLNILVHIVMYLLADLDEASNGLVGCGFTYAEYKALGWTWQEGLDEIADWAISFADGAIPALDDVSHERGVFDGQGAWYKVSKVLDSLLPLGVINGCAKTYGDETFAFDLGALIEDVLYSGIVSMDLGKILNLLTVNTDEANVFYGNSLYDAVILSVQKLINGILPGALPDELLNSMLTAITAENLIQLVRNIAASIGNRGAQLEKFAIRIFTLAMKGGATYTDGHYENGEYVTEEYTNEYMLQLSKVKNIEQIFAFLINDLGAKNAVLRDYEEVPHYDEYGNYYVTDEVTNEEPFPYNYDALIYDDEGNFLDKDHDYWKNLSLDMCADLLIWVLNDAIPEIMGFDMDADTVAAYKAAGWGWEEFLDELVDWAFSYLKGIIPALDNVPAERGVLDGNGPWYKLSLLLDALLPMSILNDCAKTYGEETLPFDIGVLVDKAYEAATELQLAGLTDVIKENPDGSNPFFDNTLVKAVLIVAQNLINGILPGTIEEGMLISLDDTLQDRKLARIGANLINSVNNRKQYLIPSAIAIMTRLTVFDFLVPWLQCSTHHKFVAVPEDYTDCLRVPEAKDVCEDCEFSFDVYYPTGKAIGYHTDLDKNGFCDLCDNSYLYYEVDGENGGVICYNCRHEGETYVSDRVEPTCGEPGTEGDTFCSRCNALIELGTPIDPTGEHEWDDGEVTTPATCKDTGIRTFHCVNCPATKEETEPIDETAHVWDDGVITTPATCKTEGIKTFTCSVCNTPRTEPVAIDPANHASFGTHTVNAKNATCAEAGYTGDTICNGCGATISKGSTINATGNHNDGNGDGYCDNCGADLKGGDRCKCGQIHTGPFAWLIKFFHSIQYFFKNLFK